MPKTNPEPETSKKRPLYIAAKGIAQIWLAAVKARRGWDDLYEVTDLELAVAVSEAQNERLR